MTARPTSAYVIALGGLNPGVVTELLWCLAERDGARVVGCEVWTTRAGAGAPGAGGLRGLGFGFTNKLAASLGARSDRVPAWPPAVDIQHRADAALTADFAVFVPEDGQGRELEDVVRLDSPDAFSVWAHQRFQHVRRSLPADTVIVASLAGGRKAMSVALHSAFTLFERGHDRLVHVVVHPSVEQDPRFRAEYACPDATYGVPVDQQLTLYDIPYFGVSAWETSKKSGAALVRAMREELTVVRARATLQPRLLLNGRHPIIAFGDHHLPRRRLTVLVYALLLDGGRGNSSELFAMADARARACRPVRDVPRGVTRESDARTLQNLARDLREALSAYQGGDQFVPVEEGGVWSVAGREPGFDVSRVLAALFPVGTNNG